MKLNSPRVIAAALLGGAAGLAAFGMLEPSVGASEMETKMRLMQGGHLDPGQAIMHALSIFALVGALVCLAIAAADELTHTTAKRFFIKTASGTGLGLVFGAITGVAAQIIYVLFILFTLGIGQIAARTLGWSILGLGIGTAAGLVSLSGQRVKYGAIGGMVGGMVGGILFDIVASFTASGTISRLIGFTAIGLCTGAGVMLVEEVSKKAWVTRLIGHNEGKQFILGRKSNRLGRDELLEIPVFADMSVAKLHAEITVKSQDQYELVDRACNGSTMLNGQIVQSAFLKDGDIITIGQTTLLFNQKAVTQPSLVNKPVSMQQQTQYNQPYIQMTGPAICPFCGQPKDPITGVCPCNPAAPAPQVSINMQGTALKGVQGMYAGSIFNIDGPTTIGRQTGNMVVLDKDGGVSRNHAVITRDAGGWIINDQGSANGIYINGMRTASALLHNGDLIHIGNTTFEFRES